MTDKEQVSDYEAMARTVETSGPYNLFHGAHKIAAMLRSLGWENDRLQRDLDAAIQVAVDNDLPLSATLAKPLKSAAKIAALEAELASLRKERDELREKIKSLEERMLQKCTDYVWERDLEREAELTRLREANKKLAEACKFAVEEFKYLGQALGEMTPPAMVDVWNKLDDALAANEKGE